MKPMEAKDWIEIAMAFFTMLLALATFRLAHLTRKLELTWLKTSAEQIGVNTWLVLQQRFDSIEMRLARKTLAEQLKTYSTAKHDEISEIVPNFFEDVGTLYKLNYLNKKLADSSFGYYLCRWWEAAKSYVDHERKVHNEDETIFEDFEAAAKLMRLEDEVIDNEEVQSFLDNEIRLG